MVKQKVLIDSNLLVALYNPSDNQHLKARNLIESLSKKENEFFIHSLIILEVLTVLKQKSPPKIFKMVKNYLFNPACYTLLKEKFFLQADDFVFKIFEENKKLSLVDAKIIEVSLLNNLALLTLDRNLKTAARKYKINLL